MGLRQLGIELDGALEFSHRFFIEIYCGLNDAHHQVCFSRIPFLENALQLAFALFCLVVLEVGIPEDVRNG